MSTVIIPLTQGYSTIIDEEDFERVSKHSRCVQQYKNKSKCKKIYAKCSIRGTQVTLHRFILNSPRGSLVDHINGDSLDNRKDNLRYTDKKGNAANRPKDRLKNATSIYKGVSYNGGKWHCKIQVSGEAIYLGGFSTEVAAAEAYNKAALEYFGEFCYLNKI